MEKMKSLFSGGKSKVYALVILQGAIGLFVGNYFIRPALVTTASRIVDNCDFVIDE
jgi:hypothetical protein